MARSNGRLDRYLLRQLGGPFFLGLFGFSLILLVNQMFLIAQQTIEKRVPLTLVLGFILGELPKIVAVAIPMGILLAVLVGFGRLSAQHEIVALRASGIAPLRMFRVAAALALLLAIADAGVTHFLEPIAFTHKRALGLEVMMSRDLSREIDPGVFYNELPETVLYAAGSGESREQGRVFSGVVMHQETPDGSRATMIVARRGRSVFDPGSGRISLLLDDGERHIWEPGRRDGDYHVVRFHQQTLTFPPSPIFAGLAQGSSVPHREAIGAAIWSQMSDLRRDLAETASAGMRLAVTARLRKARLELHRRWALPAAVLVLTLVAFPLAARTSRGGRFAGLTQALLIILAFWLLRSWGTGMSEKGTWPVWLGPWLPHFVIGVWGAYLWGRLLAGRDLSPSLLDRLLAALRRMSGRGVRPKRQAARVVLLSRVDAYLSSGQLRMTAAVLVVMVALVLSIDLKEALEEVPIGQTVAWNDILAYVVLSFPGRLRFLLPIAALIGVMMSLASLNRAGELIALRAAGVGPFRMAFPLIVLALAACLAYGLFQETLLPSSEQEARRARDRLSGRPAAEDVETGRRWLFGDSGHLWAYIDWDNRRERIVAPWVVVVDLENARVLERIEAAEATRTEAGWRFTNGWRRAFASDSVAPYSTFAGYSAPFREEPTLFREARTRLLFGRSLADQMTFRDLLLHVKRMARTGYADVSPLLVGLHEKIAQPLLPVLMVLFGLPLALGSSPRRSTLYGFGLALLITLAFWGLWAATTSLGREGVLSPAIAVWLPPGLLGLCGLILLLRIR